MATEREPSWIGNLGIILLIVALIWIFRNRYKGPLRGGPGGYADLLKTLAAIAEVKKTFPGCKTVLGISNVSYGLPARARLNAAFLCMAVYAGLDAAIIDPLDNEISAAIKTAEVLAGRDRHCRKYTRAFRK